MHSDYLLHSNGFQWNNYFRGLFQMVELWENSSSKDVASVNLKWSSCRRNSSFVIAYENQIGVKVIECFSRRRFSQHLCPCLWSWVPLAPSSEELLQTAKAHDVSKSFYVQSDSEDICKENINHMHHFSTHNIHFEQNEKSCYSLILFHF